MPQGFKLVFSFRDNPFFTNATLSKTYHLGDDADELMLREIECERQRALYCPLLVCCLSVLPVERMMPASSCCASSSVRLKLTPRLLLPSASRALRVCGARCTTSACVSTRPRPVASLPVLQPRAWRGRRARM